MSIGRCNTLTLSDKLALSRRETADAVGLSLSVVQREINAGRMRAIRVGGRILVPREAITSWLATRPRVREDLPIAS